MTVVVVSGPETSHLSEGLQATLTKYAKVSGADRIKLLCTLFYSARRLVHSMM